MEALVPGSAADLPEPRLRLVGRAIRPSDAEIAANPRARSATLRVAERTAEVEKARADLAAHATDGACVGCHRITDPVGLSLERFDGIGKFRATENETGTVSEAKTMFITSQP